ncbi:hypothetical protein [Spongiactinospora sp. TRM90649]|uniref:hypothetical protein n=1 Tax=Spongiactinospora sp. TRM90649 TaxID=3031114 RepID=UPI0023F929C7|nr:hypothetical protein [Spongiactinospora sp. TRM90649]MDF5755687.1 hypothetical protein [Spongiactinospora sp. TRM90649]
MKTFPLGAVLAVLFAVSLGGALAPPALADAAFAPSGDEGPGMWLWIIIGGLAGVGIGMVLSLRGKKKR